MKGQTAIVTGGAQGIGKIIAERMLVVGMNVMILDIDDEAADETLKEYDGNLLYLRTDISKEDEVKKAVEHTMSEFGRIDHLVNNAAISINKPVTELELEEWEKVIGTNLTGAFLMSKHCAGYLKSSKGTITNICSTRAFMSEKNTEAYSASKGGIYALAVSLGPDVRVNSISPGWIDVSGLKKKSVRKQEEISFEDRIQHPSGRVGQARDIASMIMFLISPENSFITGQDFVVDGGMTKKMIYV